MSSVNSAPNADENMSSDSSVEGGGTITRDVSMLNVTLSVVAKFLSVDETWNFRGL